MRSRRRLPPNTGQIRLGAFSISDPFLGGVGYGVSPTVGNPLDGDVLLNANNTFFFDNGAEGELIDVFNDFESLLMHEIGHALGLGHSDVSIGDVGRPATFSSTSIENLDPDDVAGIQFLYGPALDGRLQSRQRRRRRRPCAFGKAQASAWAIAVRRQTTGDADRQRSRRRRRFLVWQRELALGCRRARSRDGSLASVVPEACKPLTADADRR